MTKRSLHVLPAFLTVSSLTLLSRMLGLVRDIAMAAWLGSGVMAELFLIAFKLPNMFRRLFAEGAFTAAFVPSYHEAQKQGQAAGNRMASLCLAWMLIALAILTLAAELFMPGVLSLFAPGLQRDAALMDQAVTFARITFPYLTCIALASFLAARLQANGRMAAYAFVPVWLNVVLIATLFGNAEAPAETIAWSLCWAVLAAGVVQLLWMVAATLRHQQLALPSWPAPNPHVKAFFRRLGPGILGAGVVQINIWIDVLIATFFPGAVAWLYYADRVAQLPLALIGTAMGTALLPALSKAKHAPHHPQNTPSHAKALQATHTSWMLVLPAAAGLILMAEPIIALLFERGAFTEATRHAVALALQAYAIGLPAFVWLKLLATRCFAEGNTTLPVQCAVFGLLMNLVLNLLFIWQFPAFGLPPHMGLALATSLAAWLQGWLLYRAMHRRGWQEGALPRLHFGIAVILSCALMCLALWAMSAMHVATGFTTQLLHVLGTIALSAVVFFAALRLLTPRKS